MTKNVACVKLPISSEVFEAFQSKGIVFLYGLARVYVIYYSLQGLLLRYVLSIQLDIYMCSVTLSIFWLRTEIICTTPNSGLDKWEVDMSPLHKALRLDSLDASPVIWAYRFEIWNSVCLCTSSLHILSELDFNLQHRLTRLRVGIKGCVVAEKTPVYKE